MLWTILNDPMDSSCAHWHWNYALIDFCHFTESTLIITPSPQIKTLYMKVLFFYHTHRIPVCYNYFGYFRVYEQNLNTKLFIRMKNETLKKVWKWSMYRCNVYCIFSKGQCPAHAKWRHIPVFNKLIMLKRWKLWMF